MYQILNHYTPRESLDHGFLVLDNSRNERPDWYEYWPIRNFLLAGDLDADAYYGFFSPKLRHKTNLTAALIEDFIAASDATLDVIGFTPNIYNSAHYLNVFRHGDAKHPGLLDLAQRVFERLGRRTDLKALITDSRTEVYSNYFVAKPRFWAEWLAINEAIFALAESASDPLGAELRALTDQDFPHRACRDLDTREQPGFPRALERPVRHARAPLQASRCDRLRCAQDRLCDSRVWTVSHRVQHDRRLAPLSESADSLGGLVRLGARALLAARTR